MTHHAPGADAQPVPPGTLSRPDAPHPGDYLDPGLLRLSLALRRGALAGLEADLVEACEAAAGLGDSHRTSDPTDRARWDRSAWGRHPQAAVRLEGSYESRMCRLRDDVARLERLPDLATAR